MDERLFWEDVAIKECGVFSLGKMVDVSQRWKTVNTFLKVWWAVTKMFSIVILKFAVIVGGVLGGLFLVVFFPLLVGVLVEGLPVSEVFNENGFAPPLPDIWLYVSIVWWFLMTTGLISYWALYISSDSDNEEDSDSDEEDQDDHFKQSEVIGECPRCGEEVNRLVEKDISVGLSTVWKCPECDAILSVT